MSFFHNFETVRLVIPDPTPNNGLIFLLFLLLALVSMQQRLGEFLDRNHTDQVKGIAILLVITGHLWHHVALEEAVPIYAGYAVSLFPESVTAQQQINRIFPINTLKFL